MKIRIEVEGDWYEDKDELRMFLSAQEYALCLHNIRERIRSRLKYEEDVSDKEEQLLEEIRSLTFLELE
ncbi:MAG: hypothetical protein IMZ64_03040 [Bacteroidetes bacterium]|nr:hypothetical protein [Bacteroidota bacterium]